MPILLSGGSVCCNKLQAPATIPAENRELPFTMLNNWRTGNTRLTSIYSINFYFQIAK